MRVVVLCSSPYSETGCAMAARLAQLGHVPVGALTLSALDTRTVLRKLAQWGVRGSARYAWAKLQMPEMAKPALLRNPYLEEALRHNHRILPSLHEVGRVYDFPVAICRTQNSAQAIARLRRWAPDVVIFTGGDILRKELLAVPRLGVINSHLALLPQIRGMSSPEWSLLRHVPLGVTIHYVDSGIDTGPILLHREFRDANSCGSLDDLRNRMIAFGIELVGEVVAGLEAGTVPSIPQSEVDKDNQFFVMHECLKIQAARRLRGPSPIQVGPTRE